MNNELEKNIVGGLLLSPYESNVSNSMCDLDSFDFSQKIYKEIFKAVLELKKDEKQVDIFAVSEKTGIDALKLKEIQANVKTTANFSQWISQLRNHTIKDKVAKENKKLLDDIEKDIDASETLKKYADKVSKLSDMALDNERLNRRTAADDIRDLKKLSTENKYSFGISFLDDALNGFNDKDVIILASKTGKGKTELCSMIAERSAKDGKKVLFLALEAEHAELGARIKYRNLCMRYFAENPDMVFPILIDRWMSEKTALDKYETEIDEDLKKYTDNIFVKYRVNDFTIEDLNNQLRRAKDVDVIIIDHIHYIDILDNNENKGLKAIIKAIRSNSLMYNKPIIVAAHLRKTNKREDSIVPDIEDLHGSSDLAKIATKVILFSPDISVNHENLYRTFFHIPKCRRNPSATRFIANLKYDSRINAYQQKYKLAYYQPFAKEFKVMDGRPTEWHKEIHRG